jgi:hypothetical protein
MIRQILPAVLLPLLLTGVTIASAAWNRAGGRGPIVLSDRELPLRFSSADNSGQSVWIRHQYSWGEEQAWLDAGKLAALGFDTSVDPASPDADAHYRRELRRVAFVALEFDGPAWQARAVEYERNLRQWSPDADVRKQVDASSRLVPVDVALDPALLEARYPNPRTYMITRGVVRIFIHTPKDGRPRLTGSLQLAPDSLYIPRDIARRLATPSYRLSVRYGRRHEPWIEGAEP